MVASLSTMVLADLNGDGRSEIVLFNDGPDWCGSGGCNLVVLTRREGAWTVVADTTVSRPPILKLEDTTNGWSDLGVTIAGGGAPNGIARLRFDGRRYPSNPTVEPLLPSLDRATVLLGSPDGERD